MKVLTSRLKKVMEKVVSKFQNTFVKGRQILDASLVAKEATNSSLKVGSSGVICKLDIEKAYGHDVNWAFMFVVVEKMDFNHKWIRWIQWCISTRRFSVLVNGTPCFFQSSKGLRQGDPLSLLSICFCYRGFELLVGESPRGGLLVLFQGERVVKGEKGWWCPISYLQTILWSSVRIPSSRYLNWLLMWFEALSNSKSIWIKAN